MVAGGQPSEACAELSRPLVATEPCRLEVNARSVTSPAEAEGESQMPSHLDSRRPTKGDANELEMFCKTTMLEECPCSTMSTLRESDQSNDTSKSSNEGSSDLVRRGSGTGGSGGGSGRRGTCTGRGGGRSARGARGGSRGGSRGSARGRSEGGGVLQGDESQWDARGVICSVCGKLTTAEVETTAPAGRC